MPSRINLQQLETFLAVVRCGGISSAADQLNLTQPAVTTRIRNLEQALAVSLFERNANRLTLTKRGDMLLTYAEQFLHLTELVERDIIDPDGIERQIRLGVSETIAQSWLPEFVEQLKQTFPKLSIEISVEVSDVLRESLLSREIDLAIMLGPVSEHSVDNLALPEMGLAWYASSKITKEEACKLALPIASYARRTRPYRELKALLFEHLGPQVNIYPSSSLSASFRFVEEGLCLAALPKVLAADYVSRGTIHEFDPGWVPKPLNFTASFLGAPKSYLVEQAAEIAQQIARRYQNKV